MSFNLHSFQNRCLYPVSNYPLTHLLDRHNIKRHLFKQSSYVDHFQFAFILLFLSTFIGTVFFQLHIQVYNAIFGPFHLNLEQFIEHVNQYNNQSSLSWYRRIEYIQVELGENNIENSSSTYETIRQFSDPSTGRNHIATYKRVTRPVVFVKLPTRSQTHFHARFPFRFQSFSIQTLQCIVRNLPFSSVATYQTWVNNSDYIMYIEDEYAKNATTFNKAVLTKCGVLIGFLYRPVLEKAFTRTRQYTFNKFNYALDATQQYYSFYLFIIGGVIVVGLFGKALIYLFLYLSNIVRLKFLHQHGLFIISLELLPHVLEELWLLNIDGSPHEQLLQLDELIRQSSHKCNDRLTIIENHYKQFFVVLFKVALVDEWDVWNETSPFLICPVTDIRKTTRNGICYGEDSSWIPWPTTNRREPNYSVWLHDKLMDISDVYRERYEQQLRYGQILEQQQEQERQYQLRYEQILEQQERQQRQRRNQQQLLEFQTIHRQPTNIGSRRERRRIETTIVPESRLAQLIREEESIYRQSIERQNILEIAFERVSPATPQFIAEFRMEHENHENKVDLAMEQEELACTICMEYLKSDDLYARWPCPSQQHLFHYECMLNALRSRNTCPICRHEVEGVQLQSTQEILRQYMARLVF